MPQLSRRAFLSGAAALVATPAWAALPASGAVDVAVVGAGAAGIAAARRIIAAGRSCLVLEAASQVGGRCVTDMRSFGVPFDRGAAWVRQPADNPLATLAGSRFAIVPAPPGPRLRIGRRNARAGEVEDLLVAQLRSRRAMAEAADRGDLAASRALPADLGAWRGTIDFLFGAYRCGKDLADLSVRDLAQAEWSSSDATCRQGYGALLAQLGAGLPVALATPVTRIQWGRAVVLQTAKGRLTARAVIVTASTGVLAAEGIVFDPPLPKPVQEALAGLSLGSCDHIALELPDNPLGLRADEVVLEQASDGQTAALRANVAGSDLCILTVGGRFGRSLAAAGEAAMIAFAHDWLAGLFGSDLRRLVKRSAATNWSREPFVRGAISAAAPGAQPGRKLLQQAVRDRLWFAGEATHETRWGTVHGAWEQGERAAAAVLQALAAPAARAQRDAPPVRREPAPRRASPPRSDRPVYGRDGPDSIPYPLRD